MASEEPTRLPSPPSFGLGRELWALLALLLAVFGQWAAPYDPGALETVWRMSFFLGLVPVAGMLAYRLLRRESQTLSP